MLFLFSSNDSSGPQKWGVVLLSNVVFPNNHFVCLLAVESNHPSSSNHLLVFFFSGFKSFGYFYLPLEDDARWLFFWVILVILKSSQWVLHALWEKGQQLSPLLRIIYKLSDLPFWGYKCWQVNIRAKVDQSVKFLFSASCSSTKCCNNWLIWFSRVQLHHDDTVLNMNLNSKIVFLTCFHVDRIFASQAITLFF